MSNNTLKKYYVIHKPLNILAEQCFNHIRPDFTLFMHANYPTIYNIKLNFVLSFITKTL